MHTEYKELSLQIAGVGRGAGLCVRVHVYKFPTMTNRAGDSEANGGIPLPETWAACQALLLLVSTTLDSKVNVCSAKMDWDVSNLEPGARHQEREHPC